MADSPKTLRRSPARQRGFSLLEVVIALIIAGLALATVFRAAAENSRATLAAARYQEAISRANSHLDAMTANLIPGEQEGDDGGGYRWRTVVRVMDSTGKQDSAGRQVVADALVVNLCSVTVWVSWREAANTRSVRLDSQRLLTLRPS